MSTFTFAVAVAFGCPSPDQIEPQCGHTMSCPCPCTWLASLATAAWHSPGYHSICNHSARQGCALCLILAAAASSGFISAIRSQTTLCLLSCLPPLSFIVCACCCCYVKAKVAKQKFIFINCDTNLTNYLQVFTSKCKFPSQTQHMWHDCFLSHSPLSISCKKK